MRIFNRVLLGLGLVLVVAGNARADTYLFGFSHFSGPPRELHVGTTGGPVILKTSDAQITPGVDNQGWWSPTAPNFDANPNYIVGELSGHFYRNFFSFAIAELRGSTITSATLVIPEYFGSGGDIPVTYSLWDVETEVVALNLNDGTSAAIYADLGTGVNYGMFAESTTNNGDPAVYALNADALADLNHAVYRFKEYFSIGGSLSRRIPEPATALLFGMGVLGMVIARRRRAGS